MTHKPSVVLIDMRRSAFARGGKGYLANTRLDKLSVTVLKALLSKHPKLKVEDIKEFGLGQVLDAKELLNMGSAQIAQLAGLPYEMSKFELNRQCGSSMEVIHRLSHAIMADMYDVSLAMGVERMERNLNLFSAKATPITRLNPELFKHHNALQQQQADNYRDYFSTDIPDYVLNSAPLCTMLQTAQNVADTYNISREQCDAYALQSHHRYQQAYTNKIYDDEIVPVSIIPPEFNEDGSINYQTQNAAMEFNIDEGYRANAQPASLAALESVRGVQSYAKQPIVLTPGNCCPTNDGVSACIIASKQYAQDHGITPLAEIIGFGVAGIKPQVMGIGPVIAIKQALAYANITLDEVDYIEFNEAFASQVIATMQELNYPLEKVNVNGGSLAIGHPLGATGIRLVGTLAKQLKRSNAKYGVAAQCIGAGMGIATVIKNPDA